MADRKPLIAIAISSISLLVALTSCWLAYRSDQRANRQMVPIVDWYLDRHSIREIWVTVAVNQFPGQIEIKSVDLEEPSEAVVIDMVDVYTGDLADDKRKNAIKSNTKSIEFNDMIPSGAIWRRNLRILIKEEAAAPAKIKVKMSITFGFGNDYKPPARLSFVRDL